MGTEQSRQHRGCLFVVEILGMSSPLVVYRPLVTELYLCEPVCDGLIVYLSLQIWTSV